MTTHLLPDIAVPLLERLGSVLQLVASSWMQTVALAVWQSVVGGRS